MEYNNAPDRYEDLTQDELKLLLVYNKLKLDSVSNPILKKYYQAKINYILSLIKE